MARIKKIQENGSTIYPVTIPQAIKDPTTNKTLNEKFNEYVSKFDTEASVNGSLTVRNLNIDGYTGGNRVVISNGMPVELSKFALQNTDVSFTRLAASDVNLNGNVILTGPTYLNGQTYNKQGIKFDNKPVDEDPKFWLDDGTRKSIKELNIAEQDKEYKKLTSGFTYEIVGDDQSTSEKFSFRPTGGPNRNVRDGSARIEVLKGNSVVWNQLVDTDTTSVTLTANHKYITNIGGTISLQSPTSATTINVEGGVDKVTDLTQMFGAGNEPTTVEQFYELLPEGVDINAYNEGKIVDANYKAIKTTGFNQWDEQWVGGYYQGADGQFVPSPNDLANKNPIPIIGGMPYYFKQINSSGGLIRVLFYDHNMHYIAPRLDVAIQGQKVIAPVNAAYCNFFVGGLTTYENDICINIAWDEYSALNGQYKPYKPFERDLSWVAKYFPNGMRSAGNVADEIRFNSTTQQWEAVQRIGVVDLGSLTWTYSTNVYGNGGAGFIAYVSGAKFSNTDIVKGNILSSTYSTVSAYTQVVGQDKSIACYNAFNTRIVVIDSAYTDATAFKAAMAGVMLNYELATPIVTPITEDVNLAYDVADYGTEQLIVADGVQSAPLSAEVVYEPNVLASIKQVAAMLTRLDALETAVATMQASAVATTNEE